MHNTHTKYEKLERQYEYKGQNLVAIYEILTSENDWSLSLATIDCQEDFNRLINIENKHFKTFNIINIVTLEDFNKVNACTLKDDFDKTYEIRVCDYNVDDNFETIETNLTLEEAIEIGRSLKGTLTKGDGFKNYMLTHYEDEDSYKKNFGDSNVHLKYHYVEIVNSYTKEVVYYTEEF